MESWEHTWRLFASSFFFIRDPGGKGHEPLSFPATALTPPHLPLSINHSLFPVLKWQAGASDLEEKGEWVVLPGLGLLQGHFSSLLPSALSP